MLTHDALRRCFSLLCVSALVVSLGACADDESPIGKDDLGEEDGELEAACVEDLTVLDDFDTPNADGVSASSLVPLEASSDLQWSKLESPIAIDPVLDSSTGVTLTLAQGEGGLRYIASEYNQAALEAIDTGETLDFDCRSRFELELDVAVLSDDDILDQAFSTTIVAFDDAQESGSVTLYHDFDEDELGGALTLSVDEEAPPSAVGFELEMRFVSDEASEEPKLTMGGSLHAWAVFSDIDHGEEREVFELASW